MIPISVLDTTNTVTCPLKAVVRAAGGVGALVAVQLFWLMRFGGVAAVLGAGLAGVGNLLHPITPRDDQVGVARVIASSGSWTLVHVVITAGVILMLAGLLGIRVSLAGDGLTDALARLGMYSCTAGTPNRLTFVFLAGGPP